MKTKLPLVSVGMLVHNAQAFVGESLKSITKQTYDNLEIIISDNASCDESGKICRDFAKNDDRISYYRNEYNIGAIANFGRVLSLASGEFFMWAADHDLWDPRFIEACCAEHMKNPEKALVYTHTRLIDLYGHYIGIRKGVFEACDERPILRYNNVLGNLKGPLDLFYGLYRTRFIKNYYFADLFVAPDHVFLGYVALKGKIVYIEKPYYVRRVNRPPENFDEKFRRLASTVPRKQPQLKRIPIDYKGVRKELKKGHRKMLINNNIRAGCLLLGLLAVESRYNSSYKVRKVMQLLLDGCNPK